MVAATPDGRSLALYVHSLAPGADRARDHARRVRELAASAHVENATVTVWGTEVGLSTTAIRTPEGKAILDRIGEFRAWAHDRDRTELAFVESRTVRASVTGETYTALGLPESCLAEYADGDLVHVAPVHDGTTAHTVEDRLARLETVVCEDRPPERDPRPDSDGTTDPGRAQAVTR